MEEKKGLAWLGGPGPQAPPPHPSLVTGLHMGVCNGFMDLEQTRILDGAFLSVAFNRDASF